MTFRHERCPECSQLSVVFDDAPFACTNEDCATDAASPKSPPPPRENLSLVYFIRFADRIKIGTTTDISRRLGVLPHDELLAFEVGGRHQERIRHRQFATSRVDGQQEWFHATPDLLDLTATLAQGFDDVKAAAIEAQSLALLGRPGGTA